MKKKSIKDRIDAALKGGPLRYYDLAAKVYPHDEFPKAWRCANQGGPPGLVMALSAAIKRYGYGTESTGRGFACEAMIYPRKEKS